MKKTMDRHSFSNQASIENCIFIKTILMLLVILYHSCVYWTGNWFTKDPIFASESLSIFSRWLNSFHIYGFAFVSGYIYAFAKNELGKYSNKKSFLLGKAKRLLIPFIFVVLVWVIPLQWIFFHNSIAFIIRNYLLAENPNQLWFLWMLFDVFLVVCFTVDYFDKSRIVAAMISIGGYGIYLILFGRVHNYFQIIMAMQYFSVFIAGYYSRRTELQSNKWYVWLIIDLFLFYMYESIPTTGLFLKMMHYAIGFILHLVGAVMAWTTLQVIASKVNWREYRFLKMLSSYSMPMYLFHQQIIYFTIVWLNGKVVPWVNAGINFMVAVGGSFFIGNFFMRWKITRILIGEK